LGHFQENFRGVIEKKRTKNFKGIKKKKKISLLKKKAKAPSVLMHSCNPSAQVVEAERSQVHGQPGLYRETLSQKQNKQTNKQKQK
jgi:hypothetical protein